MPVVEYPQDLREALLEMVDDLKPGPEELKKLLAKHGVPRGTFIAWLRRWRETGDKRPGKSGRPPAELRQIVREEVETGFRTWLGEPRKTPSRRRKRST